jgi:hypothetical protein
MVLDQKQPAAEDLFGQLASGFRRLPLSNPMSPRSSVECLRRYPQVDEACWMALHRRGFKKRRRG